MNIFHQENIRFVNTYAPNITVPKYIKQILVELKKEINGNSWGLQ